MITLTPSLSSPLKGEGKGGGDEIFIKRPFSELTQ